MQFIAYMLLSRYLDLYYYSRSIKNTFLRKKIPTYLPTPGWEGRVWGNKQSFNFGLKTTMLDGFQNNHTVFLC